MSSGLIKSHVILSVDRDIADDFEWPSTAIRLVQTFLGIIIQATHGLWSSAGLKMPTDT